MTRTRTRPAIADEYFEVFAPQYRVALDLLKAHRLGWPVQYLAAEITLRLMIITWKQVQAAHPELAEPPVTPDARAERSRSSGEDEALVVDAIVHAAGSGQDVAEWIACRLATAAQRLGGTEQVTVNRPGSWEASLVDRLLAGTVITIDDYAGMPGGTENLDGTR
ncbi:MAG: hypothetical protein FWE35_26960 [Streptosporangiales bacterium]|nr:hypothetical protein [Streptosporangiales bacterium]